MPVRRPVTHSDKSSFIESIRSDTKVLCQNEFIAKTDKRVKSGKAQSLAKWFIWKNEKSLQQKRERLKDLLSMESNLYQQELINDFKTKTEEEFESRKKRLFGLKAERERERLKFVEEMRVLQLINDCDEIRPYLRQKLQDECKNCQLLQIEDNNLKKMEKLDEDRLWHGIQKQVFNQMTQREFEESLVAQNRNFKDQQILRKQISEKNEIVKDIDHEEDTMNCGKIVQFGDIPTEQEVFIQSKLKQRQLAQDLLSQQEEKARSKKGIRNREILHDLALIDRIKKEIKLSEENLHKEKKQNLKETLQFLDFTKSVKKEKSMVAQETDFLTGKMESEKNHKYLKNRNDFHQQRDEFYKGIYEERWKQITDKRQKILREKSNKINEIFEANQIYADNACVEKELLQKKMNFRKQYGRELMAQLKYEKLEKDKAAASSITFTQINKNEGTTKNELIKNNLGRIHEIYPLHPNFKAILNSKK